MLLYIWINSEFFFGGKSSGSGGAAVAAAAVHGAALGGRFPLGGDVFCQIILLYRFITAIKAKPSLTMHQIQGSSLKVHVGTGFRRQFVSQSATSNCFWQIGDRGRGNKR